MWILIALAVVILALACVVLWRARQIRNAVRAIHSDTFPPAEELPPVVSLTARHEATFLPHASGRIPLDARQERAIATLRVTERDIVFSGGVEPAVHIPLARVIEAMLIQGFDDVKADEIGGILRIDWERGRQRIISVFAIDGTLRNTEQARREIHLRAGKAKHPAPTMPG